MYRLASVTKPITATAVLQLVEAGKVDLDAPIQRYVPAFPEKQWPVTVRHLLSHQSGIRNWTDEEFHNTRHFASIAESLAVFKDDPLLFEPGTRTQYTSLGYNLMGAVVEGVSGKPFLDYLARARVRARGDGGRARRRRPRHHPQPRRRLSDDRGRRAPELADVRHQQPHRGRRPGRHRGRRRAVRHRLPEGRRC